MARVGRTKQLVIAAALFASAGCMHGDHHHFGPDRATAAHVAVPPAGAVPRELEKITLPPYVIEAPDQLLIEVIQKSRVTKLDDEGKPVPKLDAMKKPILDAAGRPVFAEEDVAAKLPIQAISGSFNVRPEGSVNLGIWGNVPVSGLSLDQAAESIRQHLVRQEFLAKAGTKADSLFVIVDVLAYNSKRYYVITDGGGFGEQVFPFPITGSETVLDALANINGLPDVASKRNIWVARRTPHPGQPWQILPVDWVGTTQHGHSFTNYQVMPGDRIYVKAQRLVTIDRTLARIFAPVERVFGVTLLGTNTVNQLVGRGQGFGNNNN
jgi:polysaccharide biosynthesis/export protein